MTSAAGAAATGEGASLVLGSDPVAASSAEGAQSAEAGYGWLGGGLGGRGMASDLLGGKGSMEDLPARDFLPCRTADALLLGVPAGISLFSDETIWAVLVQMEA